MTSIIRLERFAYSPVGTFGRLSVGPFQCYTVERPLGQNRPNIDCIPEGEYPMALEHSPRFGEMLWELKEVPGRSEIKIHAGNTMDDLLGCIAPGKELGLVEGKWGVTGSRLALVRFMDAMKGLSDVRMLVHFLMR